jgi:hypothetical protein
MNKHNYYLAFSECKPDGIVCKLSDLKTLQQPVTKVYLGMLTADEATKMTEIVTLTNSSTVYKQALLLNNTDNTEQ